MIAVVFTVKNEADILSVNWDYHRASGVDHCYIFDDGSTDGCTQAMADRPDVTVMTSADARRAMSGLKVGRLFEGHWHHELNARKGLNAQYAATLARDSGHEWLINIDPDEFVFVDLARRARGLRSFFRAVPDEFSMVVFPNYEVMQSANEGHPFWTNVCFKSKYLSTPNGIAQSDFRRRVYNPFTGISWWVDGYYGHSSGKSAIRLTTQNWQWHPSGHWATDLTGTPLRGFDANDARDFHAGIAHYFCHDFRSFEVKFQNYAGTIPDPRINDRANLPTKATWIAVVNGGRFSHEEVRSYFREWIAISESEIDDELADPTSGVVTITSVREELANLLGQQFPSYFDLSNRFPPKATARGGHYIHTAMRRRSVV